MFSIPIKVSFLRSSANDFSLDLKNVRFRSQFNCFGLCRFDVALICGRKKLHYLNGIKQSEARQVKLWSPAK